MSTSKNGGNSSNFLGTVPISSIMTKDVKTASEDQSLYEICKIMHDNNIGSVISSLQPTKRVITIAGQHILSLVFTLIWHVLHIISAKDF